MVARRRSGVGRGPWVVKAAQCIDEGRVVWRLRHGARSPAGLFVDVPHPQAVLVSVGTALGYHVSQYQFFTPLIFVIRKKNS